MTRAVVPRLHLVGPLDGVVPIGEYAAIAASAAQGGVDAVHVRLPGAPGRDVLSLATDIQERVGPAGRTRLLVNDRVDVALLLEGAGIHLGERSIPVRDARRLLGQERLIGRSIHDRAGAMRAQVDAADFVIAGHVFATDSKHGVPGKGLDWLSEICRAVSIPVVAIGGVRLDRVSDVLDAGAWGIAVGRQILTADDARLSARMLSDRIGGMQTI